MVAGIKLLRPGKSCREVYKGIYNVFREASETVNLIRYVYGLCLSSVFGGCLGVSIGQLYVLFSDRKVFPGGGLILG